MEDEQHGSEIQLVKLSSRQFQNNTNLFVFLNNKGFALLQYFLKQNINEKSHYCTAFDFALLISEVK